MADIDEITPEAIKGLREKKKLSQEKLASLLGVSTSTVIRWEQGAVSPTGTVKVILMAMLAGPIGLGLMMGMPAFAAYGIYRALKDVYEPETTTKKSTKD